MQNLGYEFAKFRLKDGVEVQALLLACDKMEIYFLKHQPGFISRRLVALDGGEYLDLLVAETREAAEKICGNWKGNTYCEAFIALIDTETVSIGFGEELAA